MHLGCSFEVAMTSLDGPCCSELGVWNGSSRLWLIQRPGLHHREELLLGALGYKDEEEHCYGEELDGVEDHIAEDDLGGGSDNEVDEGESSQE
ncbi:hypothetical protein MUK42_36797 [Musa troglodytarum]|uniref:Uncharacterized protein n=1 Tax=Musa troglodytarum TaxID=320322 RepID=A0A9E7L1V9_9LILI|nr:hypothetical protein MUK42_36797 [Musa troglodytarum]